MEDDLNVAKRKLNALENDQKKLAQVTKDSVIVLNVTRIDVAKNKHSINWLVNTVWSLGLDFENVTLAVEAKIRKLDTFLQQYLKLLVVNEKLHQ